MNDELRFKLALRALEMVERIALVRQPPVEPALDGPSAPTARKTDQGADNYYMDDSAEDLLTKALNMAISQPPVPSSPRTLVIDDEAINPADLDGLAEGEDV